MIHIFNIYRMYNITGKGTVIALLRDQNGLTNRDILIGNQIEYNGTEYVITGVEASRLGDGTISNAVGLLVTKINPHKP